MAGRWMRIFLPGVVVATVIAACSSPDEPALGPTRSGSEAASPFLVDSPPAGYQLAGVRHAVPYLAWGDDSIGTDEPFVVLAPEDEDAQSQDAVVISTTGFRGYEGGFSQASPGYNPAFRSQRLRVDGDRALFTPAQANIHGRREWSDLVVQRGPDVAVRVRARNVTVGDLTRIAKAVIPPSDTTRAPRVVPPSGMHVVGAVDADVVGAAFGEAHTFLHRPDVRGLGAPVAYGMLWSRADEPNNVVAVVAIPGVRADLDAVPAYTAFETRSQRFVSTPQPGVGAAAWVVSRVSTDAAVVGLAQRTLVTTTPWGDVLVVASYATPVALAGEELAAIAASARKVSPEEWAHAEADFSASR